MASSSGVGAEGGRVGKPSYEGGSVVSFRILQQCELLLYTTETGGELVEENTIENILRKR